MYTTSPLSISTGQYEQALLQGAVNKRISIFQYIKKAYPSRPLNSEWLTTSHESSEYWCDTVLCAKEGFEKIYMEQKGLGKKYFAAQKEGD